MTTEFLIIFLLEFDQNSGVQPSPVRYELTQLLQFATNITACDKHVQILTNIYKLWQTEKKTGNKQKINGDIEALADARQALKKMSID